MELFRASFIKVLEKTMEITPQDSEKPIQSGYVSSIELLENKVQIFIVSNKEFLKFLSKKMIFEDNPDDNTLVDIAKEFANLIVGYAKVIAEDRGERFHISTPVFCGRTFSDHYLKAIHFRVGDMKYCSIFMKV